MVSFLDSRRHSSHFAVPEHVVLGELAGVVREVVVVVILGLAVVVVVVPHLALPAVAAVSAVVVGVVLVLYFVVHAVVSQVEPGRELFAWPHVSQSGEECRHLVRVVGWVIEDRDLEPLVAVRYRYWQLSGYGVVLRR